MKTSKKTLMTAVATAAVALLASSKVQAASYGMDGSYNPWAPSYNTPIAAQPASYDYNTDTAYNRYGFQGNYQSSQANPTQPIVQNYNSDGHLMPIRGTNFDLYNFQGETYANGVTKRYWQSKTDTVDAATLPDYSTENGVTVYNFDEYGNPLATSVDYSQYNYLGDTTVSNGIAYRFWSAK